MITNESPAERARVVRFLSLAASGAPRQIAAVALPDSFKKFPSPAGCFP